MDKTYELDVADNVRRMDLIDKYYDNDIENYKNFEYVNSHILIAKATSSNTRSNEAEDNFRMNDDDSTLNSISTSETASNSDLESLQNEIDAILMTKDIENSNNDEIILSNIQVNPGNVHHQIAQNGNSGQHIPDIPHGYTTSAVTNIEKVAIQSSSDIQFGNKTFINGPTTVIYLPSDKIRKNKFEEGKINDGFEGSHDSEIASASKQSKDKLDLPTTGLRKYSLILTAAILFLLLVLGIFLIIELQSHENGKFSKLSNVESDGDRPESPSKSTIGNDILTGDVFRMIPRAKWLAQPSSANLTKLELPVGRVIIIHTATETCETQAACIFSVRQIQTYHIESYHFDDIGYNFLIGGDGAVYEGRGWDLQGAHTLGYNKGSIGIAFIGTFNNILPNEKQLNAGFQLMRKGVELGKLTNDYKIFAHRQLAAFESPGARFYELIKTWDHWSVELDDKK